MSTQENQTTVGCDRYAQLAGTAWGDDHTTGTKRGFIQLIVLAFQDNVD